MYTLTYTKSGRVHTSTCLDWAAAAYFHIAPACPGTDPYALDASLFTVRNYSTFKTAEATNTSSALTTTSASFVTTTSSSAAVTYTNITEVIYGTTSGSASATSTSTSSASVFAGRLPLRSADVVLFSSVYAFVALICVDKQRWRKAGASLSGCLDVVQYQQIWVNIIKKEKGISRTSFHDLLYVNACFEAGTWAVLQGFTHRNENFDLQLSQTPSKKEMGC